MENVILTPETHCVHFHARDGIRAIRLGYLTSEGALPPAALASLSLAVADESNLVFWRAPLSALRTGERPNAWRVEREFPVWENLTVLLDGQQAAIDFQLALHFETIREPPERV